MLVHLNGQLVPHERASVSVFDRAFIFGDALYEGLRALRDPRTGKVRVVAMQRHIERLAEGLGEVGIEWDAGQLRTLTDELLAANGLADAFVYWQVSRGVPDLSAGPSRARVPGSVMTPTVFGYATPLPALDFANPVPAVKRASALPDERWMRGRLKTTSLIGNVMASLKAADRHSEEAILIRDTARGPFVSEGTYTNVVIARPKTGVEAASVASVDDLDLITPALQSAPMLAGVTRGLLVQHEPKVRERIVRLDDLATASEIMLVGTTTMVTSVTHLDDREINGGVPGPAAEFLLRRLLEVIARGKDDRF